MASPRKLLAKVLSKTALRAEQDIEDARYNLEGERYHIACFLSQQSAEKALKAFLYAEGEEMVWGHSVAELCKRVTSIDKDIEKIRRKVATLDKYYIPTRYPNGLPGGIPSEAFEKRDADRAIEIAEEVIQVIEGKL
ncbi:MAG: HEPN domain-containing protein [Methanophagales archaeon]|nr:HEPN domain-containing protein [Methanophagales archaeon]